MSTIHKEESSQIMADCQAKLIEIDHKLSQIKSRCRPKKTKHKYSLNTNEDFIILKRETESLESDVHFVKSLLDETTEIDSSFPLKIMKKLLPLKMFTSQNKAMSNEIKAKIIAHSTALLEEKVKVLQTISSSKKKKKRRPKPESIDSTATETSTSYQQQKFIKVAATSDSEIIMCPEKIPSMKVLSSLKRQNNFTKSLKRKSFTATRDFQMWSPELDKCKKTAQVQTNFQIENNKPIKKVQESGSITYRNLLTFTNKYVQTSEVKTPKNVRAEKIVQTGFPSIAWITSILKEHNSTKFDEKGTNTEQFKKEELPVSTTGKNSDVKQIQEIDRTETVFTPPGNILDINEIDNIINNLLSSPLKMLQCKHINKLCGGDSPGFVNLIIRQSDFMPLLISGIAHRKEVFFSQFIKKEHCLIPYVYGVKQTLSPATIDMPEERHLGDKLVFSESMLDLSSSMNYTSRDGKSEYSVEYKVAVDTTNKNEKMTNTLQIDYENPQASGRIIMTEYGNSQSPTQTEMISRILTHLIGLPNTHEKNS